MATTLQNLIDLVRQESNMENNQFVTDTELITYLNYSLAEMDDIMIDTHEDYRLQMYTCSLQNGNFTIPTPAEMLKLRGVDIQGNGTVVNGLPSYFPLRKFQLVDRGRRNNLTSALTYPFGKVNLAYFWQGNQGIIIYPQTQANGNYQIWWVPKYQELTQTTDVLPVQADTQAWVEYAVVDVCIKVLTKQDLDPSGFMARKEPLRQRLIDSMANRDIAGPDVRANVRNANDFYGGSYGGNFGGYGGSW